MCVCMFMFLCVQVWTTCVWSLEGSLSAGPLPPHLKLGFSCLYWVCSASYPADFHLISASRITIGVLEWSTVLLCLALHGCLGLEPRSSLELQVLFPTVISPIHNPPQSNHRCFYSLPSTRCIFPSCYSIYVLSLPVLYVKALLASHFWCRRLGDSKCEKLNKTGTQRAWIHLGCREKAGRGRSWVLGQEEVSKVS